MSTIRVTWSDTVDAGEFSTPADFKTLPSTFFGAAIVPVSPTELDISWAEDISTETDLNFLGTPSPPGVTPEQTITIIP